MTLGHLDTIIAFVAIIAGVSVLVTTFTQAVSAVLGLRGTNLYWGIQTLLLNVDPNLEAHVEIIAQQILHHPLISDSSFSDRSHDFFARWKLASAIRQDELIKILRMLAKPPGETEGVASEPWRAALRLSLDRLMPAESEKLLTALPEIKKLFPDDPTKVEAVMAQLIPTAEQLTADIGDWFNPVMDRVSQRFAMHTRCWTVVFAVILAFLLQLDAFKLFNTLSSDPALTAQVVANIDGLTKKADEILATEPGGKANGYIAAMKQLIKAHPEALNTLPEPAGFSTLDGGQQWLAGKLPALPPAEVEKWTKAYEAQVQQSNLRTAAANLNFALENQLSFHLVPDPYPDPVYRNWVPTEHAFWGILASVALLSLGAPFWFNLLKTMSNLRPILANKESKERADSEAIQEA